MMEINENDVGEVIFKVLYDRATPPRDALQKVSQVLAALVLASSDMPAAMADVDAVMGGVRNIINCQSGAVQ